jgi:hypothetical protein
MSGYWLAVHIYIQQVIEWTDFDYGVAWKAAGLFDASKSKAHIILLDGGLSIGFAVNSQRNS